MAIDDHPFDALDKQFQMEDTFTSPFTRTLLAFLSAIPLPLPFDKIVTLLKEHMGADSAERMRIMVETCMDEVRKHAEHLERIEEKLSADESRKRTETLRDLMIDAARKAERTRAKERVRRIGLILGGAALHTRPDEDDIEEMMRVAMDLSDGDLQYLYELIRIEGHLLRGREHIPRYDGYNSWENGPWGDKTDPDIDSAFSKLESYGLVARIAPPNNLNIMADFQNRYVLLPKGLRFHDAVVGQQ